MFDDSPKVSLETQTLSEIIGFPFWLLSEIGLGEHWILEESEAKKLAKAIQTYYKSLPKRGKNVSKFVKTLEKNLPLLVLLIVVMSVVAPRLLVTYREKKDVFTKRKTRTSKESSSQSKGNTAREEDSISSTNVSPQSDLQSLFAIGDDEYKKSN